MMKKKVFAIIILALIVAVSYIAFERNKNKVVNAVGYSVQSSNYKEVISSTGIVEYDRQVAVKTEVAGTLLELNGQVGDIIAQHALVAKLDNKQALIDYNNLLNQTLLAKAKYEDYMKTYNTNVQAIEDQRVLQQKEITALQLEKQQLSSKIAITTQLVKNGATPTSDLDALKDQLALMDLKLVTANTKLEQLRTPQLSVEELKASIKVSNENVDKQKNLLTKYSIESPIEGIIIDKKVEAGTYVQAGETLLTIASDKEKYVVVDIDEKYLSKVSIGKEVQISIKAYPAEKLKGSVVKINPEVNKDKGTIGVKIKILDRPELFLQNMTVNVEFIGEAFDNSIVIPAQYLVEGADSTVYIVDENGLVVKKKITVYNKNAKAIRVVEGLKQGDIILNPTNLKEGTKVEVSLLQGSENGQ
jgi:HlyD family secretion protein